MNRHLLGLAWVVMAGLLTMTAQLEGMDDPAGSQGPGQYRLLTDQGYAAFPFEVFRGDIRFQAKVNDHEVKLLLDDGYMWDALLFWGSPEVEALGLHYDGNLEVGGSSNGESLPSKTASGITLALPGVTFTGQTAVVTPASSGNSDMWWGSLGQVSATLFKHFVVDINFDSMTITLIPPEEFDYQGQGVAVPWTPLGSGGLSIPITLCLEDDRRVSLELMMDLGYNDQLELCTGRSHDLHAPETNLPLSLGFNIKGEETTGSIGRLPAVEIGGYSIKEVLAGFVSEEQSKLKKYEGMIGLNLLRRFNLVFDYSRQRLFVEPNQTFEQPFEYNMSGMTLVKGRGEYLVVTSIMPRSAAEEAGLKKRDRVIRINGRKASEFDYWALKPLLREKGKTITLTVSREGRERTVSIVLRRLI